MVEALQIPIENPNESSFELRTELETRQFVLRFDWNTRDQVWVLSIFDALEVAILIGIPLRINTELLFRWEIPELPPGRMLLYDTSEKSIECGRDDLGNRCILIYETSE